MSTKQALEKDEKCVQLLILNFLSSSQTQIA